MSTGAHDRQLAAYLTVFYVSIHGDRDAFVEAVRSDFVKKGPRAAAQFERAVRIMNREIAKCERRRFPNVR